MSVPYQSIITIEPGKRGGKPCIRGMRITVHDVLSYLAAGMSHQQILDDFDIVPILPEQRRVAVAKSVPALQWNAQVRSDRLDIVLHDPAHPVGLLALHLRTRKDIVAVCGVWLLSLPQQQFLEQIHIERNPLLRSLGLHILLNASA